MTRVSNLAQHNRNLEMMTQTQELLQKLQTQIGSGRKSQDYEGIARDTSRLLDLEQTGLRVQQYLDNNRIVELRLNTMETSISQVFDVMAEFKALLVNALNGQNAADLNLQTVAQHMLDQVSLLLNAEFGGRFLFAGSRTDTPPVDPGSLPPGYVIPTADGDSSAYYQGDQVLLTARADDSLILTYGAKADDLGLERAIRALHMVVTGVPTDRVMLNHSLEVTNQAIDDIADLRTRVGSARSTIEDVNRKHDDFLLFTERNISDIENVDVTEAMTRLTAAQVRLEASFVTLTRLQQSTLVNFLR